MQRRTFLKIGAAGASVQALSMLPIRAHAAEFSYKWAQNLPITHPMYIRAVEATEKIKAETKGRVEIQVFPSSQLGSDTDSLSQLRAGGIEFFNLSGLILSTLVAPASLYALGFAFKDYDTVWKAMDGDLGAYIRTQIQKSGLVAMDKIWDNGFRQITTSSKPINSPDDLKGMKIRVPPSPQLTSAFKSFGAAATTINFNEVYSSLQTKIVDAQENPLAIISTAKLYEVQKFCTLSNHMWDGFFLLANRRVWEKLPADLRTIVAKHMNAAAMAEREDVAKLTTNLKSELEKKGMVFNNSTPDLFRETLRKAGYYAEWKEKYGPEAWAALEKYSGKLA